MAPDGKPPKDLMKVNKPVCIATIKFSRQEVELMTLTFETYLRLAEVWYGHPRTDVKFLKKLLGDLKSIKKQMLDKENEAILNIDDSEQSVHSERCVDWCE